MSHALHAAQARAADLNKGFSYETDDDGEYRDEDGVATSPSDYITDALDLEFHSDGYGEFTGADILVTYGGPTVIVKTNGIIEASDSDDAVTVPYSSETADLLFDACKDLFEATRG